jgi:hypothetical protein
VLDAPKVFSLSGEKIMSSSECKWVAVLVTSFAAILCLNRNSSAQVVQNCVPGWHGYEFIDCESAQNWSVEHDGPSTGTLDVVAGVDGQAVRLNWNLNGGDWVQAKYTFPTPEDLSEFDVFGFSLRGSSSTGNRVSIMMADVNGVFYGLDNDDINIIQRWMINLTFPKKMFYYFFTIGADPQLKTIEWSKINRVFVVVKRPDSSSGGGSGSLSIDLIQADRAADWPRQSDFESITPDSVAQSKTVSYILNQQQSPGLIVSWKEESEQKAYLYDQALALIVLSREGRWQVGTPQNEATVGAKRLADFIVTHQKSDGHWARAWLPRTGAQIVDDQWIGDQAWCVIALNQYIASSGDTSASAAMQSAAAWLAAKVQANGFVHASTEATVDVWWAMIDAKRFAEADRIQNRLLSTHWDADLKYWMRGYGDTPDPVIAMDAATWVGEFARTSRVNRPDMALAALGFVRRALITIDNSGALCGFDGMGPVSLWCEGTAQYISAGGEGAQDFLNTLLSLQRPDGGMPGSPDDWPSTCFGWLSSWTGLSATAWLYFALTESPFTLLLPSVGVQLRQTGDWDFCLLQNFPNPFNAATEIPFELKQTALVKIRIYNSLWQEVHELSDARFEAGSQRLRWDGNDDRGNLLASGLYFCRMEAAQFHQVRKMTLLR